MSDKKKGKPKRKKTGSKPTSTAKLRMKVGAKNPSRRGTRPPSDLTWVAGMVLAKEKAVVDRKRIGAVPAASFGTMASMESPASSVADATVAVDFELKLVNPASNIAPAIRVVAGGVSTDVSLRTADQEKWFGGISAPSGTQLQIFASARVKKDGSMTLSVKEPGFTFPPVKVDPVNGLCGIGPLPYRVG